MKEREQPLFENGTWANRGGYPNKPPIQLFCVLGAGIWGGGKWGAVLTSP